MVEPSVFGEIPGHPVGTSYENRLAVKRAGLHRHPMHGISGNPEHGADAIVVSGGYREDVDEGPRIIYTGQGGRARNGTPIRDQTLTLGNLGLARSREQGLPVRVIRGAGGSPEYSPVGGYRYDGLYSVTDRWIEPGLGGFRVWRFVLEKIEGDKPWAFSVTGEIGAPPVGNTRPGRKPASAQRLVRLGEVSQWVKRRHEGICQICGIPLDTPAGRYSEGAHLRGLGAPHNGPDVVSNVLCLCPNDHVLFDAGAVYLDGGNIYATAGRRLLGQLRLAVGHSIDWDHAAYHREHIAGIH